MVWRKKAVPLQTRLALAVFEHSPDGIMLARKHVIQMCNPAAERLLGRKACDIVGKGPETFAAPFQHDGRPSIEHLPERQIEIDTNGYARFEWLNLDGQGNVLPCLITLLPIRIETDDEVLVLIHSLAETATVVNDLRHGLDELSRGNLSCHLRRPFRDDYEGLRGSFNSTVDAFADSVGQVMQTAQLVASGAQEIQCAAKDLSSRSEQQAIMVETTANVLHQISTAMSQSADASAQASRVVTETRQRAEESGALVARTAEAMERIETSSREIFDIVSLIDGIALQTNLLAFNAGVEAARAGDAGRGFAVVASEVRALAQRSADAARDIKGRIEGAAYHVTRGVELVTETGGTLSRIVMGVADVNEVMNEIAQATIRHATRLRQANVTMGEMDQITLSNASMSEEASAAARGLAAQSDTLMQKLGRFRVGGMVGRGMHAIPQKPVGERRMANLHS